MEEPKIVALCGSSWFVDIMAVCAWLIERDETGESFADIGRSAEWGTSLRLAAENPE